MTLKNGKYELLTGLCRQNAFDLMDFDLSDDQEEDVMMEFTICAALILQNRRGFHSNVPKSLSWTKNVLPQFDDNRMRQMLRVSENEFRHILSLIKDDPVFKNKSYIFQMPVDIQLKITLFCFGSSGDSASFRKVATLFGIGDGGTIINVTKRVVRSILNLKARYLYWPQFNERKKIVSLTMYELPGCVEYIDGTEIRLAERPAVTNKRSFWSRTRQSSIKVQLVCDHRLVIRHANIGHHGSVHDARIFAQSSIGRALNDYFDDNQFIAGDSAYALSQTLITPFRNSTELTQEIRDKFNIHFSKYRVRIENCFAKVKEVFCSLKELRFRLHTEANYKECCEWILACLVLHNILIIFNDPDDMPSNLETEYPPEILLSTTERRATLATYISNL